MSAAFTGGIALQAAAAVYLGAKVVLFELEVRNLEAAPAETAPAPGQRTRWVAEPEAPRSAADMGAWRAEPGLAAAARRILATRPQDMTSAPQRLLDLASALSAAPTDGALWAALADATLKLGYGTEHALHAYDMATLTARREGDQMFARALLVFAAWERIPDDRRQAAMAQLAAIKWRLKAPERSAVARMIANKEPAVLAQIAAALIPRLGGDRRMQKALGL